MKLFLLPLLFLTACQFHPLFGDKTMEGVCVSPISEYSGYQLYQALTQHFPDQENCSYALVVQPITTTLSDQSISDKDFTTMQRVQASAAYKLLNQEKEVLISNTAMASGSSAVVINPYSTVVSLDKTTQNLIPLLADQIASHVAAYLDRK